MLRGNVWSVVRSEVILSAVGMSPVSAGTLLPFVPVCGHVAVTHYQRSIAKDRRAMAPAADKAVRRCRGRFCDGALYSVKQQELCFSKEA
ncbi:hypothetical protein QQF64_010677 [Cirrhinus molitorella]|uniref:Secreted protein n=1 Tax=Cirrhinus molitorella TaxID=172907 RepID=A0ABR3M155_9TELE